MSLRRVVTSLYEPLLIAEGNGNGPEAFEYGLRQAIAKGYAGEVYHARASWMRTRGIPIGTGWFIDKSKSGGGALIDIGWRA